MIPPWVHRGPRRGRPPFRIVRGGEPGTITYPTTPLGVRVRIALGADLSASPLTWAWRDITEYVRFTPGIEITSGRRDWSEFVTASVCRLTLDNTDGRFVRRNPTSEFYGLLSKNTPIWIEVNPGNGYHTRYTGFVNEWPTRWREKGRDSLVPIQCAGILRRLQLGGNSMSALRRTILAASPVSYHPLEDDADTKGIAASGLSNGAPMRVSVAPTFAADTGAVGSAPLPTIGNAAQLSASFIESSTSDPWTIEFVSRFAPGTATTSTWWALRWYVGYQKWDIGFNQSTNELSIQVLLADDNTDEPILQAIDDVDDDTWHHWRITATDSSGSAAVTVYRDGEEIASGTSLGTEMFAISGYRTHPRTTTSGAFDTSIGHIAAYDSAIADHSDALAGYTGEQAHARISRLCEEEGVRLTSAAATSPRMGPQPVGALLSLLRECEVTGQGVLYEHDWGLAFQSIAERYNASVSLSLDFDQHHIANEPEPADDDQRTANKWRVSRSSGSEATAEQTTGPMGTGPDGPGTYEYSTTVNTESDLHLSDQAYWRLHIGTVDEDRWPRLDLRMHRTPDLIPEWVALGYGARTQVDNPPAEMPPDTIKAVVEGHTERIDTIFWDVSLNSSPSSPYDVGVYGSETSADGPGPDRYDTAGSELAAAFVAGTDTSMSVTTTTGPIWTTDADDFPFNIKAGGVVLEVTSISGASSPQTFTITQTPVNGVSKTIPAGTDLSLAEPAVYAL